MVRDFGEFFAEAENRHVSQHELDAIIMKIDPHGDGIITKEEFIVWMYQKSCAVQVTGVDGWRSAVRGQAVVQCDKLAAVCCNCRCCWCRCYSC